MKNTHKFLLFLSMSLTPASSKAQDVGFYPQQQPPITQRSREFTIRLKRTGPETLRMSISKRGRQLRSALLPSEMAEVYRIEFLPHERAVLLGAASGDVDEIVMIDLNSAKIMDRFFCYAPSLSPDKRYLVFVKFFTPHFVPGVSAEYMRYDFRLSPAMNRPSGVAPNDVRTVGRIIYPEDLLNQPDDNEGKQDSAVHMLGSQKFFWANTGSRVAFADSFHTEVWLVEAVLSDSGTLLKKSKIQKTDVCRSPEVGTCTFDVRSIEFGDDDRLKVRLRPDSAEKSILDEIDVDMQSPPEK